MNNVQFYSLLSGIAASVVTTILAWILSNVCIARLVTTTDAGLREARARQDAGFRRMEAAQGVRTRDLREFYRMLGKLEGRFVEIAKR